MGGGGEAGGIWVCAVGVCKITWADASVECKCLLTFYEFVSINILFPVLLVICIMEWLLNTRGGRGGRGATNRERECVYVGGVQSKNSKIFIFIKY